MRAFKIVAIIALIYVGIVTVFESLIGYMQPANESTLVITTFETDGKGHDRVVSRLESDGKLYVAANHWPRAWYRRAVDNPDVQITLDGAKSDRKAVPVAGEEYDRVNSQHALPIAFRFLTGFPSRPIVRLDAR